MQRTKLIALATTLLGLSLAASQAHAAEGCKVKIDSKTGAIQISARKIGGTLRFGNGPIFPNNQFANAATCIKNGKATKCELGAPGSADQITPPELCKVFLRDTGGPSCSAFIKGCTPGVHPGGATPTLAGGAKAGVIAFCSALANDATIRRSFNNVNGGAITIDDGTLSGRCEITFPFSLEDKFFSVEAVLGPSATTTFKVDYSIDGNTMRIGTLQYFAPAWVGLALDVSVLVF